MPYATKADMIARFGEDELIQISDREGLGVFSDANFAQAQKDGDGEIDGYLQGRYPLPLVHVPSALCRIACDLYRYYLYTPRTTEEVEKRYDNAVKFLKSLAKGEVNLGLAVDAQPATTSGSVRISTPERIFTQDRLKDY